MAARIKAWLEHGTVDRSGWCDIHGLPHVFTYDLVRLTEYGVTLVKTVKQCDTR